MKIADDIKIKLEYEAGLVSVIIPTYNRAHFIEETLDSVFSQTYRPIEVIIVDDGSIDNTDRLVKQWRNKVAADTDFAVRYFYETHEKPARAENLGLHEARGEYIQFLDSDDLLSKDKIAAQVAALSANPGYDAAYCAWRTLFDGGVLKHSPFYQKAPAASEDAMLRGYIADTWFLPYHAYLFTRKAVIDVGPWDEGIFFQDDTDYLITMLLQGHRFLYVPDVYVEFRRHLAPHVSESPGWASAIRVKEKAYLFLAAKGMAEKYMDEFRTWYQILLKHAAFKGGSIELKGTDRAFQQMLGSFRVRPVCAINRLAHKIAHLYYVRVFRQKIGDSVLAWIKTLFSLTG